MHIRPVPSMHKIFVYSHLVFELVASDRNKAGEGEEHVIKIVTLFTIVCISLSVLTWEVKSWLTLDRSLGRALLQGRCQVDHLVGEWSRGELGQVWKCSF